MWVRAYEGQTSDDRLKHYDGPNGYSVSKSDDKRSRR